MDAVLGAIGTAKEVAQFLGISEQSLAQDRARGVGPAYIKHGRRVRYRWADVEAYLKANTVSGGAHGTTARAARA